jgi:hypothetical protein
MKYLYVKWVHKNPGDPVHIYSELDNERYEVRKVEIYSDGRRGFADKDEEKNGTVLGSMPVPPIAEIAQDKQYEPKEIPVEEFQRQWLKRR